MSQLATEHLQQIAQFLLDLIRAADSSGYFGSNQFAIACSQAMDGYFHRALSHVEPRAQLGVGGIWLVSAQRGLQGLEERHFPDVDVCSTS